MSQPINIVLFDFRNGFQLDWVAKNHTLRGRMNISLMAPFLAATSVLQGLKNSLHLLGKVILPMDPSDSLKHEIEHHNNSISRFPIPAKDFETTIKQKQRSEQLELASKTLLFAYGATCLAYGRCTPMTLIACSIASVDTVKDLASCLHKPKKD